MKDEMAPPNITLFTRAPRLPTLDSPSLRTPKLTLGAVLLFTLGFLLDTYTTSTLITQLGFTEANPLIQLVFTYAGVVGILSYKTGLVLAAIGIVTWTDAFRAETAANLCLFAVGTMWLIAGLHNIQYIV